MAKTKVFFVVKALTNDATGHLQVLFYPFNLLLKAIHLKVKDVEVIGYQADYSISCQKLGKFNTNWHMMFQKRLTKY